MNARTIDGIRDLLPRMDGWCTVDRGMRLAQLVTECRARLCIELGVFGGRSLVAMALGLLDQGFGRIDGIDPYTAAAALDHEPDTANDDWWATLDYERVLHSARETISRNHLSGVASIHRLTAAEAAPHYADGSIDLLHQDSNHGELQALRDVERWAPKMTAQGTWIMNDIHWVRRSPDGVLVPTMIRARQELERLGFAPIEAHDTWAVFRRGASPIGSIGGAHLGGAILENGGDFYTWMPDVWERLIQDYSITSVLDIGCGAGFSTKWFLDRLGEGAVLGVEGDLAAVERRQCDCIRLHDFSRGSFDPQRTFDLGWCAEFVEHVEARHMYAWLWALLHCRYVAMTFAVPGQGGHHHVNERPEAYWLELFGDHGFEHVPEETARLRATSVGQSWGRPTLTFFRNRLFRGRGASSRVAP